LLHILIGDDDFSIRQALEEIKKAIGDPAALMPNTIMLDGRQVTPQQLRAVCDTVPFLAEKRLVIVEGLLGRFEPRNKTGRKKPSRPPAIAQEERRAGQPDQPEEYQALAEGIKQLPPFTELVLMDGRINDRNPLLRELMPQAKVKFFPLLKESQLRQWIERWVTAAAGTISPPALALMVRFVGNDLWTMANEVDKLVLFAGGRRIEEADVRTVVSYVQEANVFAMVDAIMEFRAGLAQELLQQLFRQGAAPAQLLVMLSRQARIIFLVKEMRDRGKSRGEIQNKLGLTSDFLLRKAWEQADKYSLSRLHEVYHKLLETDISIKTGKLDGELALDVLIAELGQRAIVSA
jgi:DNA polymerase III subunit delta